MKTWNSKKSFWDKILLRRKKQMPIYSPKFGYGTEGYVTTGKDVEIDDEANTWESDIQEAQSCPHLVTEVHMPIEIRSVFDALSKQVETEYLAYLTGKIEGTKAIIDGFYIPKQRASAASVDVTETGVTKKVKHIIGVLHKHPDGINDFSGTDEEFRNYPVNVLTVDGKYLCQVRTKTPCGHFMTGKAEVITLSKDVNIDKLKEKIEEEKYDTSYMGYTKDCPYEKDESYAKCKTKDWSKCHYATAVACPWDGTQK